MPPSFPVCRPPRATYRVQLHAGFTFDDLAALVPYLDALGISDCYCSPILQATPGSKHGYDVCDCTAINRELGGREGLERLVARLREHRMGLLLDFVPNHMGIEGPFNPWWQDVLELGSRSPHAAVFDIVWDAAADSAVPQVLLPVLPDHYGQLMQAGKLQLHRDGGDLRLTFDSSRFPLRPSTYAAVLRACGQPAAEPLAAQFEALETGDAAPGAFAELRGQLAGVLESDETLRNAFDATLRNLNGTPGDHASFDRLDALIQSQHYRLARWQSGAHGTNYRRFFAINTLIGVRVEDEAVFERTHALLGELLGSGLVTGLRIDHIDGLRDPQLYLERLQALAAARRAEGALPPCVYVEKITAPGERLPESWVADGTTGYEFIAALAGLLTAPENEAAFDALHRKFTGCPRVFADVVRASKALILDELFAHTVLMLAQALHRCLQIDRRWRDLAVTELAAAIRELMIHFSVYRTYRRAGEPVRAEDEAEIRKACVAALRFNRRIEPALVVFVSHILMGRYPEAGATREHRDAIESWVLTFQQYTGAVMAKSVEDTAYYTCNRLIALNEVGGFPEIFGARVRKFHEAMAARRAHSPRALLATSTHDTKVSEDVRARLYALSEIPAEWSAWLEDWSALNARHKTEIEGRLAPDADEEYRLYQTLLGAWPASDAPPDAPSANASAATSRRPSTRPR